MMRRKITVSKISNSAQKLSMANCAIFLIVMSGCFVVNSSEVTTSGSMNKTEIDLKLHEYIMCRTNDKIELPLGSFYDYVTCGRCYQYMPNYMFKSPADQLIYKAGFLWKTQVENGTVQLLIKYIPDAANKSSPIYDTFVDSRASEKWEQCCQAAIDCCHKMNSDPPLETLSGENSYCPRTWDGWTCVGDTKAKEKTKLKCPDHVYFSTNPSECEKHATKQCTSDGTWYQTTGATEWTDYTPCSITEELLERIYVHCASYAITILAVVPAIILFSLYKQLQVPRIKLHKNLFISLLANAICVLAFKSVMANHLQDSRNSIITTNSVSCKLLLILTRYFRSTNYMWMFCEGFYLHKLIAAAFAEQKKILPFYIIGWGFPVIVVIAYSAVRSMMFDSQCWAMPADPYEWIINGPNMMSIVINFGFLANILRVLWSKLQARHANEPSQFRKAVKATIVLIPLFGVHFLLILYRPQNVGDCIWTKVHFYAHYLVDGLQGFVVALIYCYMNSEVRVLLKRSYRRTVERYQIKNNRGGKNRTFSYTTNYTTVAESINHGTTFRRDKCVEPNDGKGKTCEIELTPIVTPSKNGSNSTIN